MKYVKIFSGRTPKDLSERINDFVNKHQIVILSTNTTVADTGEVWITVLFEVNDVKQLDKVKTRTVYQDMETAYWMEK